MGIHLFDLPDSSESDSNYKEFIKRRNIQGNIQRAHRKPGPYGPKSLPRPEHTKLIYSVYPPGAPGGSNRFIPPRITKQPSLLQKITPKPTEDPKQEKKKRRKKRTTTTTEVPETTQDDGYVAGIDKNVNIKRKIRALVFHLIRDARAKMRTLKSLKEKFVWHQHYRFEIVYSSFSNNREIVVELFNGAVRQKAKWRVLEMVKIFELMVDADLDMDEQLATMEFLFSYS